MQDLVQSIDAGGLTGLDRQATERMTARAKRFNLEGSNRGPEFSFEDYVSLYDSLNIPRNERPDGHQGDDETEEEDSPKKRTRRQFRLQAVTVRGFGPGTDKEDVHHYFREFNPVSMELVDGNTVNVVWALPASAAKALLSLSRPLVERGAEMEVNEVKASEVSDNDEDGEDKEMREESKRGKENLITEAELAQRFNEAPDTPVYTDEIEGSVPDGVWRIGKPPQKEDSKAGTIFMTLAPATSEPIDGAELEKRNFQLSTFDNSFA